MSSLDFPALSKSFSTASQEMLAAVLDQSADCIKVMGPTGSLDFMNRNGRCAMGIDDFADVAGKDWWELWPDQSKKLVRDAVDAAHRDGSARFEAYCPTAKGEDRWWDVTVSPLRDEEGALRGLISVSRDVSADVLARDVRETTAAEMKHRLRNAYALTSAIVMTSARGREEHREFAIEITERLERLGIAQALLLDSGELGRPSLDRLVRRMTEPFCAHSAMLDVDSVPDITLSEDQVRALALVLGEFSTNSNKYGAFGHGGSIKVEGKVEGGTLTLSWHERSDRPVAATAREGSSGLMLIRRVLAGLHGALDVAFRDDGVDLTVTLPGL